MSRTVWIEDFVSWRCHVPFLTSFKLGFLEKFGVEVDDFLRAQNGRREIRSLQGFLEMPLGPTKTRNIPEGDRLQ